MKPIQYSFFKNSKSIKEELFGGTMPQGFGF